MRDKYLKACVLFDAYISSKYTYRFLLFIISSWFETVCNLVT